MHRRTAKIINIFGVSCSGKSTFASELFAYMKKQGADVELVAEWIKPVFYEEHRRIPNQLLVTGKQIEGIEKIQHNVEYIIMESPIYLGSLYADSFNLRETIKTYHRRYNNHYNILLKPLEFKPNGRGTGVERLKDFTKLETELNKELHCIGKAPYICIEEVTRQIMC